MNITFLLGVHLLCKFYSRKQKLIVIKRIQTYVKGVLVLLKIDSENTLDNERT